MEASCLEFFLAKCAHSQKLCSCFIQRSFTRGLLGNGRDIRLRTLQRSFLRALPLLLWRHFFIRALSNHAAFLDWRHLPSCEVAQVELVVVIKYFLRIESRLVFVLGLFFWFVVKVLHQFLKVIANQLARIDLVEFDQSLFSKFYLFGSHVNFLPVYLLLNVL